MIQYRLKLGYISSPFWNSDVEKNENLDLVHGVYIYISINIHTHTYIYGYLIGDIYGDLVFQTTPQAP